MSAREDIKRRRRRRERQERWERDPRRPVSPRTLRRLKAMCRKLGPIPGGWLSSWGALSKHLAYHAAETRAEPGEAPWRVCPAEFETRWPTAIRCEVTA